AGNLTGRRHEVSRSLAGRKLADVEDDPTATQSETGAQPRDLRRRGRRRGRGNVVDRLNALHALQEPGAPVDVEDPLAHADHAVEVSEKALLEPAVEPEVEERELRAELPPRVLHVQGEVLLGALPPELPHAAVGRHSVVMVETDGRGVDDRAVADREKDGHAQE